MNGGLRQLATLAVTVELACATAMAGNALFGDSIIFYAPLDGTCDAAIAGGAKPPVEVKDLEFIPGRKGQALVITPKGTYAAYSIPGNLNPAEGTVTMWVRIIDWFPVQQGPDRVNLFRAGDGIWFGFNPYWLDYALFTEAGKRGIYTRTAEILNSFRFNWLKQTDWIFLAITWQNGVAQIFVNGNKSDETLDSHIAGNWPVGDVMRLGQKEPFTYATSASSAGTGRTGVDEFTIYNRALQPMEIKLLFDTIDQPAPESGLLVSVRQFIVSEKLDVWMSARMLPNQGQAAKTVRATFLREGAATPMELGVMEKGMLHAVLPTAALKPGDYELRFEALDAAGKVIASTTQPCTKEPLPEWVNNSLGKEDVVPAPFTPLQYQAGTISCYGRTYDFQNALLPVQITSQGTKMLAAPMALQVGTGTADGKVTWTTIEGKAPDSVQASDSRVVLRRSGAGNGIQAEVLSECEFDGTVWLTLTVKPAGDAPVDIGGIRLEIPIDAATMPYVDRGVDAHFGVDEVQTLFKDNAEQALRPLKTMAVYNFNQGLLLGTVRWARLGLNEDPEQDKRQEIPSDWSRGPATKEWDQWRPTKLSATSADGKVSHFTIQLNVLEGPYRLTGPREFTFYFQALPVKPRPKDLYFARSTGYDELLDSPALKQRTKAIQLRPLHRMVFNSFFFNPFHYCKRDEICPPTVEGEAEMAICRTRLGQAKAFGIGTMAYLSTHVVRYPKYFPDWSANVGSEVVGLETSYPDFAIWNMRNYVRQLRAEALPMDGIYYDNTLYTFSSCPITQRGWKDETGQLRPAFNMRDYWTFRKRMYLALGGLVPPRDLQIGDNIPQIRAPFMSFDTRQVYGEGHIFMNPPEYNFDRKLLIAYRTKYQSRMWTASGIWFSTPVTYLENPRDRRYVVGPAFTTNDFVVGLAYLHGINADGNSGQHYPHTFRLWEALDYFDLRGDEVQFAGYWENADRLQVDNPEVPVSLYTRPGRALLFVLNLSRTEQQVKVKVDLVKLGLRPFAGIRVSDPFNAEKFFMEEDGSFTFPMRDRGYRPLIVCDNVIGDTEVVTP